MNRKFTIFVSLVVTLIGAVIFFGLRVLGTNGLLSTEESALTELIFWQGLGLGVLSAGIACLFSTVPLVSDGHRTVDASRREPFPEP